MREPRHQCTSDYSAFRESVRDKDAYAAVGHSRCNEIGGQ